MTTPSPPSLFGFIRRWLGTDRIPHLEEIMISAKVQLDELKTAFTDFRSDLTAKLDQLAAAQGELQPDAQVIFDSIKADLAEADTQVGDADGSDSPPVDPNA